MDSVEMRRYIQNFSFDNCERGNQGYNRLLIQLFGYTGHGKSSFINSCKYVLDDGDYAAFAKLAGEDGGYGGQTMSRDTYQLTDTITLVDNRGCVTMNRNEIGAIYTQLGNFQKLDTKVTWHKGYGKMLKQLLDKEEGESGSADFIVPVFVYSAEKTIADPEVDALKEILCTASHITKIFPAVVITHETSRQLPEIKEKFRWMGVLKNNMFPLENYTEQNPLKIRGKHEQILNCLYEIIRDVEFRMREIRNPKKEMKERREILHTFLIEREKALVKEAAEKADAVRMERERREREAERERAREREQKLEKELAEEKEKCVVC